jgi:hypothetical protein
MKAFFPYIVFVGASDYKKAPPDGRGLTFFCQMISEMLFCVWIFCTYLLSDNL